MVRTRNTQDIVPIGFANVFIIYFFFLSVRFCKRIRVTVSRTHYMRPRLGSILCLIYLNFNSRCDALGHSFRSFCSMWTIEQALYLIVYSVYRPET